VNLHHNDLSNLAGIEKFPSLMKVDLSSNDLTSARGLEGCSNLREVDLSCNDLTDADSIIALATRCPRLTRLKLDDNDLTASQVQAIQAAFAGKCTVICDVKGSGGGGGCCVQ